MTRSVFVPIFILNLSVLICVQCRSQGNYLIQNVIPSTQNDPYSTTSTESPIKFTRKTFTTTRNASTTLEAYISSTILTDEQNEVTQKTSASTEFIRKTTIDDLPEHNLVFSETVYRDKICKNEPTCHMVDLAPEELMNLGTRNCMCDEDCRKYGDCCLDSPHYNATEQRLNYQSFYCSEELVYMKTKCPEYYIISNIRVKCEKSSQPLISDDEKLATPVTNPTSKITYGNEYCAQCHNDYDYQSWNFTYYCSEDTFVNTHKIEEDVNNETESVNPVSIPERDYLWEMNEAAKHVKYDPVTRSFRSAFNGRNYICSYYRYVSENMRQHVRTCIPSIAECSSIADQSVVQKCLSYTDIVYNKNVIYKNKDCAACNKVDQRQEVFSGCKI